MITFFELGALFTCEPFKDVEEEEEEEEEEERKNRSSLSGHHLWLASMETLSARSRTGHNTVLFLTRIAQMSEALVLPLSQPRTLSLWRKLHLLAAHMGPMLSFLSSHSIPELLLRC
jgi:hypothetical protein